MKIYLILAHKNPRQLNRLIHALNDGQSCFFIHLDKAVDRTPFHHIGADNTNVFFVQRERTSWGSYRIVSAILHGLNAIVEAQLNFTHVILLSGQDYPIKSNAFISRFTEQHADKSFIQYFQLPNYEKWEPNGGLYRVNKYFIGLKKYELFCSRALNLLATYIPLLQRRSYKGMLPYAGSMWWMMNRAAVQYVLGFLQKNPGYTAFHRYTFAPDEVFFQTLLLNAATPEPGFQIVNDDLRFIKWKDITASHPENISHQDLPSLEASPALFARKFEAEQDTALLDIIDHSLLSIDHQQAHDPLTITSAI